MNFFQSISELGLSGDLRLNITRTAGGRMAVSVMLVHSKTAEETQKLIRPLLISGSPQELDDCLIAKITEPMQATSSFFDNSEAYLKSLEQAKKTGLQKAVGSRPEPPAPKTEAEKKQERYQASMKKADELEREGKFRDAWMKVPDIGEYPENETEIRARREALSAQFEPNLFS